MKKFEYLIAGATLIFLAACSELPTHDYNKTKANVQVSSTSKIEYTVSDTKTVTVDITETAGGQWSAVADKDWIKVSKNIDGYPAFGTGSAKLLIRVTPNDETFTDTREGSVQIKAEGADPASIAVVATIPVSQDYLAKGQSALNWGISPDSTLWKASDADTIWKAIKIDTPTPTVEKDTVFKLSIVGASAYKIRNKLESYGFKTFAALGDSIVVSPIDKNDSDEKTREAYLVVKNYNDHVVAVSKLVQGKK
ncbi:MAG: hypothetical protein LBD35_06765 [Prevotellaceae bacterium]|jgi:hypothetical protein|nr:hypothetical protein [Prevotellaceae bacterium]